MSECEKCLWYGMCQTYEDCRDFTPVECDLDAALEVRKQEYRSAFAGYIREHERDRDIFSTFNTIL